MEEVKIVKAVVRGKYTNKDATWVEIYFERNGAVFVAPLFWKVDKYSTEIVEVLEEKVLSTEKDNELVEVCIDYYMENGGNVHPSTPNTMRHWQFIGGFSGNLYVDLYKKYEKANASCAWA